MATSKYEILQALLNARVESDGDPSGWHHLVHGILYDIAEGWGSEDALAECIYERIVRALIPAKEVEDDGAD